MQINKLLFSKITVFFLIIYSKLFMLEESPDNTWTKTDISICGSDVCFNGLVSEYETNILSFGEDDNGEVICLIKQSNIYLKKMF